AAVQMVLEEGWMMMGASIGRLSGGGRTGLAMAALVSLAQPAMAQEHKLDKEDLAVVAEAYVEGVAELYGLLGACAPVQPPHWQEAGTMLAETMRQAGMAESQIKELGARLSAAGATYDCQSDLVGKRLADRLPSDWIEFHRAALKKIGIELVSPRLEPD